MTRRQTWTAFVGLAICLSMLSPALATAPLLFAVEDDWMPYSGTQGGRSVGLTVDIVREAFASQGVRVLFSPYPYARCMGLARESKVTGCFNTQRSPLYEPYYRYARTPLIDGVIHIYGLAHQEDGRMLSLADLEASRVGMAAGFTFGAAFDGNPRILKDESASELVAFRKLLLGRVDYVVAWEGTANRIMVSNPELAGKIKVLGHLSKGRVDLSFARHYSEIDRIISQFEAGMGVLAKTGQLKALEKQWLHPVAAQTAVSVP